MGFAPPVDMLQHDLCSGGGFTELRKIAASAQAGHQQFTPHVWGSDGVLAASLQFIATLAPAPFSLNPINTSLEYGQKVHPFFQDLFFLIDAISNKEA